MKVKKIITAASLYFSLIHTASVDAQLAYNLDDIRRIAHDETGSLPLKIEVFIVAKGYFPGWVAVKGNKNKRTETIYPVFLIRYTNYSILVDASFSRKCFEKFKYGLKFYDDSYDTLQKAFKDANDILFTHEHQDHISGISSLPEEYRNKLILSKEQLKSKQVRKTGFSEDYFNDVQIIDYEKYYRQAQGVVLIKSPGHTPGHQMVYIRLQSGDEYLLIGDIAWYMKSIENNLGRHWFVSAMLKEHKRDLLNQLKWLNQTHSKHPKIKIIPSHDPEHLQQCVNDYFYIYTTKNVP